MSKVGGPTHPQSPENTANFPTEFVGRFEVGRCEQKLTRILSPIRKLNLLPAFYWQDQMFIALTTVLGHYKQLWYRNFKSKQINWFGPQRKLILLWWATLGKSLDQAFSDLESKIVEFSTQIWSLCLAKRRKIWYFWIRFVGRSDSFLGSAHPPYLLLALEATPFKTPLVSPALCAFLLA